MVGERVVIFESADVVASVARPGLLETRFGDDRVVRLPELRAADVLELLSSAREHPMSEAVYVVSMLPDLDDPALDSASVAADCAAIGEAVTAVGSRFVIVGASTYESGDTTHDFAGGDTYAVRATRLTAALQTLCHDGGYEFVDVDRTIAEIGAEQNAPKPSSFSDQAADFVTEDVLEAIAAGSLDGAVPLADVMEFCVPDVDARVRSAVVRSWGAAEGELIAGGSSLVRLAFTLGPDRLGHREHERIGRFRRWAHRRRQARHESGRRFTIDVKPSADVHLAAALVAEGAQVDVGQRIAVMTAQPQADVDVTAALPQLPMSVDVAKQR